MASIRGARARVGRYLATRRNMRRLWGDAGKGLLPPPHERFASFGEGSFIIPPARVQMPEHIHIGRRVVLHEHIWLCVVQRTPNEQPLLEIGDGTSINRFVKIVCAGHVSIGSECLIGDHVFIADTHYRYDDPDRPIREQELAAPKPVIVGNGCHIGVRAMIGPGVTIGEHAYVGAGAVVTEDVPARSVVVGYPARIVRRYDEKTGTWITPSDQPRSPGLMA